jgi:hypothetical protein
VKFSHNIVEANDGDLRQNPRIQPGDYVVVYESIF